MFRCKPPGAKPQAGRYVRVGNNKIWKKNKKNITPIWGKNRPRHSCDTSCNSLSGPIVAVPTLKGEEKKTKTCRMVTNPHSGEVFGDLNSSPHFPPLCQVRQKNPTYSGGKK